MSIAARGGQSQVTAEQLADLPDDGWRHELIEGELTTMAPAGRQHGKVAIRIGSFIFNHVEENHLGECTAAETGFLIQRNPDTVRAPDVAFTRTERVLDSVEWGYSTVVPDLVIEVVSPSDRAPEVSQQALVWLDAGVQVVWVIDPKTRVITVHRSGDVIGLLRGDDAVLSGEDVLPGFTARLGDIFG